jgi:hypothetical protein
MEYLLEGTAIDLTRTHVDVTGVEWVWTGELTESGEPLMMTPGTPGQVPLTEVYYTVGPLIPVPAPIPAAVYRRVLEAA